MANIYKFDLEWKPVQTVRCKAVKILDIQSDGYVWHWFTDFNYQYAEGEEK